MSGSASLVKAAPSESTARSLLLPVANRPQNIRRISDVMTEYSFDGDDGSQDRTHNIEKKSKSIMLKIGRANNITRRMNEWQRQCGYALNLVRWYPYVSSTTPASQREQPPGKERKANPLYPYLTKPSPRNSAQRRESDIVHKCPHIHRVERLIHLELASKQIN